ncbi:MAG: Holliday junction resolvase RuvX [Candidatus Planktophila sp.]|nr:Holliday junction resolvase RuvX [Candidatus Planktophila sp.]
MQRGRRIAFDYGDVRIGVAICDPDAILASPLTTLSSSDKKLILELTEILTEYEPVTIYVGKPSNMDGSAGAAAEKTVQFCALLATLTTAPIVAIDERLSTVSAARSMRDSGVKAKAAKSRIDQAAAVAILEFALAIEKNIP